MPPSTFETVLIFQEVFTLLFFFAVLSPSAFMLRVLLLSVCVILNQLNFFLLVASLHQSLLLRQCTPDVALHPSQFRINILLQDLKIAAINFIASTNCSSTCFFRSAALWQPKSVARFVGMSSFTSSESPCVSVITIVKKNARHQSSCDKL